MRLGPITLHGLRILHSGLPLRRHQSRGGLASHPGELSRTAVSNLSSSTLNVAHVGIPLLWDIGRCKWYDSKVMVLHEGIQNESQSD